MTGQMQVSAGGVHDLGYHVVAPKYRRPVLPGAVAGRCEGLIGAKADEREWRMVAREIRPDHVHLFVKAHPRGSPSRVVDQFNDLTWRPPAGFMHLRSRLSVLWSRSYFAATVGAVSAKTVRRYIDTHNERPRRKERAR